MNKKEKTAIILDALLLITEIIGFIIAITQNGILIMGFYTQESNLVLLVATAVYLFYKCAKKDNPLPKWVSTFKFVATCLVSVTFFVVVLVFVPMVIPSGADGVATLLLRGASLFHHLICPVLSLIVYLGFERDPAPGLKQAVVAMYPTLGYAVVSTTLNILKVVEGPYPFLYVYKQPVIVSVIWFILIPGGGFLYAWGLSKVKRKIMKA